MTDRTDTFDRADGAIGTPSDGGSAWSALSGTWSVATNQAREGAGTLQSVCVLESSVSDVDVQATFATVSVDAGLISRAADNSNYIVGTVSGSQLRIFKRVAGTFTQIGSFAGGASNGDVIKLTSNGSGHALSQNGTSRATGTASEGSTNTQHGLRTNNSTATRFDDFSITGLGGGGALSGSSAATSGATGTLTGNGALSGTSAATSGATATLSAIGALIGSSQIVSGATGTLIDAIGHLSGTIAAASGATGNLADANFVPAEILGNANLAALWQINSDLGGARVINSDLRGAWAVNAGLAARKPG